MEPRNTSEAYGFTAAVMSNNRRCYLITLNIHGCKFWELNNSHENFFLHSFPLTKRFYSNTGLKFNDFDFKM